MSLRTYNFLWNLKQFWRRYIKKVYVDLGVKHPFLFLNYSEVKL